MATKKKATAPVNPDPMGWAQIEASRQRKVLYDISDAQNHLPPGTSATQNGEPDLAPDAWAAKSGGAAGPEPEALPYVTAQAAPGTPTPNTDANGQVTDAGTASFVGGVSTATGGPAAAPAAAAPKGPDKGLFDGIASYLSNYGLGSLFTVGADGTPGGWLWEQMVNGVDTADEIKIAVESTQQWKDRFGVIVQQRNDAAAGKPVQVMTPDQVIAYESTAAGLMRQAGLPKWLWDQPSDFNALMLGGVSPDELNNRLGESFNRVKETPPAVRAMFEKFYGVGQGDAALASFFLDPDRTIASIDKASRVAYTAGMGTKYGLNIDKGLAEAIADKPITDAGIDQGLENVNRLSGVFREGIGEANDLTAEGEGVASVFMGDGQAQQAINRRLTERGSNNRSTTGGAAITQRGVVGV